MGKVLQIYGSCYYNSSSNISGDDLRQIFMMPGSEAKKHDVLAQEFFNGIIWL